MEELRRLTLCHELKFLQSLSDTMLRKSFMAKSTAPRIDASLVRHERAEQATCSIALILSSLVYVFPRYRQNGAIRKRDARRRYRRRIDRVLSRSAYVLTSLGLRLCLLHLGIYDFRCEREFESSKHRTRWNVACAGATGARVQATPIYDCVI